MKKIVILIVRGILNIFLAFLLILNWFWYVLATSDVPPVFNDKDINIIISFFITMFIMLIFTIVINEKCRIKGSYLLFITGSISLFLWVISRIVWDFNIGDGLTNLCAKRIINTGIVFSVVAILSQLLQIFLFYKRRRSA